MVGSETIYKVSTELELNSTVEEIGEQETENIEIVGPEPVYCGEYRTTERLDHNQFTR
jgi:hypothetical protein